MCVCVCVCVLYVHIHSCPDTIHISIYPQHLGLARLERPQALRPPGRHGEHPGWVVVDGSSPKIWMLMDLSGCTYMKVCWKYFIKVLTYSNPFPYHISSTFNPTLKKILADLYYCLIFFNFLPLNPGLSGRIGG